MDAYNARSYTLTLTGAELTVLDRLVRDLDLYSPARRGLHEKIRDEAARSMRDREKFYSKI
jgi:hypothetical protein